MPTPTTVFHVSTAKDGEVHKQCQCAADRSIAHLLIIVVPNEPYILYKVKQELQKDKTLEGIGAIFGILYHLLTYIPRMQYTT